MDKMLDKTTLVVYKGGGELMSNVFYELFFIFHELS